MKIKIVILTLFLSIFYIACEEEEETSAVNSDAPDCTALAETFVEKMEAVDDYRSSDDYDSSDAELKATCDGMCAEVVAAAQALLDNSCEWPEMDDGDAPTGPVTQDDVDGLESGFCGETGVCA